MRIQVGNTLGNAKLKISQSAPFSVWQPSKDEIELGRNSMKAHRRSFRQRAFKSTGMGLGIGVAGLLGGIALMSTGPIGCLPGVILLLLTPVAALTGGLFSLMKRKER